MNAEQKARTSMVLQQAVTDFQEIGLDVETAAQVFLAQGAGLIAAKHGEAMAHSWLCAQAAEPLGFREKSVRKS